MKLEVEFADIILWRRGFKNPNACFLKQLNVPQRLFPKLKGYVETQDQYGIANDYVYVVRTLDFRFKNKDMLHVFFHADGRCSMFSTAVVCQQH